MPDFEQQSGDAPSIADVPSTPRRAPGKRTRTQALPKPKEPAEIVMTGYQDLDDGMACDGIEATTPECPLNERAAIRLENKIQNATLTMVMATNMAISNVFLDLRTKHGKNWGPMQEAFFMVISTTVIGYLASVGASAAARAAVSLAEHGAVKAAWSAAGIDSKRIAGALTMVSKSFRTALAHPSHAIPQTKEDFLKYLTDEAAGIAEGMMAGIAAEKLSQLEMLELLARLQDPNISGRAAIEARVRTLLGQFEANRIGEIGEVTPETKQQMAYPVRVRVRKQTYVVLCEGRGYKSSSLSINGSDLSMNDLVFVRIVEPEFHDLVEAEFFARHAEAYKLMHLEQRLEFVDFDKPAARAKHRWFDSLYVELMHRPDAHELAASRGDIDVHDDHKESGAAAR